MCRCPVLSVALLFALLAASYARPSGTVRVCGHHLADVLAVICDGRGYNDPFSAASPTTGTGHGTVKRSAESTARGVADECCKNGCTYRTMEQYCSPRQPADSRSLSQSEETHPTHTKKPRGFLSALVDQVRGRRRRKGEARCRCRRRQRRGKRVDGTERQATTEPPPPFRVGVINSYFNGFVLPPTNRLKPLNVTETVD